MISRPILRGLQIWDYAPRRIAVIALDSGTWCFAWIVGGPTESGARVRLLGRAAGDKYPTCVPVAARADRYVGALRLLQP
ncbi:hypothetical protein [Rhodococcus sp. ABRD24]|uniref:hypothetical protein n=1 Tax=Rhodococcus sp. ABRD24 TaxID=2507582 RepID=UPI001A954D97|nr:hypothetical protein [Rhodococcus sp. ABRD24]